MLPGQSSLKEYTATSAEAALYTIQNSKGTRLVVSSCGAAVVSLFIKDKQGNIEDIVLGYDDMNGYSKDEYYIGTVVGRYANRIAGSSVVIDGDTYLLTTKEGGYHQHGGECGFNKKIFNVEEFKQRNKSGIVFTYTSPHLEEGFPGELELQVIYTLDEDDNWTIEYKATSDRTTLVNLTQHSYFNLSGKLATTIDEHLLQINCYQYLPVNDLQVPTGNIEPVANTPFDFTELKAIGKDIADTHPQLILSQGYDHSFVLKQQASPELKKAAIVKDPSSGRKMEVFTTEPAIHFYSGNFLNNVHGKKGIVYNKRSGFCLETQHFPDAPNHNNFPSTLLKAGEEFYSKTIFKFSAE